jgi:Tfp pilus assembly protein PilF
MFGIKSALTVLAAIATSSIPAWGESYLAASFANRSGVASLDWIGESIGETIRASLIAQDVVAISRGDREHAVRRLSLRGPAQVTLAAMLRVAADTKADRVVWGEYEIEPLVDGLTTPQSHLRITARLIDIGQSRQLASFTESAPLEELATLQRNIAWRIFQQVRPNSKVTPGLFEQGYPSRKMNALENYIRGLLANQRDQQHHFYTQAVRIEPSYDEALFALGRMQWEDGSYGPAASWLARVSTRSYEYPQALFLLGASLFHQGDFGGALQAYSELALRRPVPEVLNNAAAAQLSVDREAATHTFRKLVDQQPNDPDYRFNLGYALWAEGKFEEGADLFRGVLDRTPNNSDAILMLGRCLKKSGPRPTDLRTNGLQRIIEDWDRTAPPRK